MEAPNTLPPRQPLTDFELPNDVSKGIEEAKSNWLDFIFGSKEQRENDMDFLNQLKKTK